jgi:cytochrome c peroxidase
MLRPLAMLFVVFLEGSVALAQGNGWLKPVVDQRSFRLPAEVPSPAGNEATPDRIQLGKMLFFDSRLSGSNLISCATCHNPDHDWSDGLRTAVGEDEQVLVRATPSIINSGFNQFFMWDGSFRVLEDQVWRPMLGTTEMHGSQEQILSTLRAIPGYILAFDKAYPGEGISRETVAKAIATFERTLISRDSPFDRWIDGDETSLSVSAKDGFAIFTGKGHCAACHQNGNFTDQGFHNIGLKGNTDPGRFAIVPILILRGSFKTPSLRDVYLTPPYMHDGSYFTLEEVVDHYDRGGDDTTNLDPNIKPLRLTKKEKKDLVEFLKSLTGRQQAIVAPVLPQ